MRMFVKNTVVALAIAAAATLGTVGSVQASGGGQLDVQEWSWNGMFGSYDRPALKRGFQVYAEVCAGCHSLNLVAYRNLLDIGISEEDAKAYAEEFEVEDLPDDEGEVNMRPAKLADKFVPPFANEKAARASNNGAMPPDLSLMIKARFNGPDYVYSLLTGYHEAPEGFEVSEGMNYNTAFGPAFQIAMAPPLDEDSVEYEDGTEASLEREAKDIVTFLAWAASPELEERKELGVKVLLFLLILSGMLFAVKRKIWAKLH